MSLLAFLRGALLLWGAVALSFSTSVALAEDGDRREEILDADGPPSLPGLTHAETAFNYEYTVAVAEPTDVSSAERIDDGSAYAYTARWLVEAPLASRVWFVGIQTDVAAASVPSGDDPTSGGSTLLFGNPELWARGMWSNEAGLSAGGGLGLVVPIPRSFSSLESEVVRAVRVIRPMDFPHFQDLTLTGRPFFDIRHVTAPVVLQMRQGLDFQVLLRDRDDNENRYDITAFVSAYIGVQALRELTFGLEIAEVYQITADTSSPGCIAPCDEHRVQFTMSPSIRLRLPNLSPAISVLFPLSTPLRNEVASYVAGRLHLDATF